MPRREPPARIPHACARGGGEKIRAKRLILPDSDPEMQRIAGGSRLRAKVFGHRQRSEARAASYRFMICSRQGPAVRHVDSVEMRCTGGATNTELGGEPDFVLLWLR